MKVVIHFYGSNHEKRVVSADSEDEAVSLINNILDHKWELKSIKVNN